MENAERSSVVSSLGGVHSKRYRAQENDEELEIVACSPPQHRTRLEASSRLRVRNQGQPTIRVKGSIDLIFDRSGVPLLLNESSAHGVERQELEEGEAVDPSGPQPGFSEESGQGRRVDDGSTPRPQLAHFVHRFRTGEPAPFHERPPLVDAGPPWWKERVHNASNEAGSVPPAITRPSSLSALRERMHAAIRNPEFANTRRERDKYYDGHVDEDDESNDSEGDAVDDPSEESSIMSASVSATSLDTLLISPDESVDPNHLTELDLRASLLLRRCEALPGASTGRPHGWGSTGEFHPSSMLDTRDKIPAAAPIQAHIEQVRHGVMHISLDDALLALDPMGHGIPREPTPDVVYGAPLAGPAPTNLPLSPSSPSWGSDTAGASGAVSEDRAVGSACAAPAAPAAPPRASRALPSMPGPVPSNHASDSASRRGDPSCAGRLSERADDHHSKRQAVHGTETRPTAPGTQRTTAEAHGPPSARDAESDRGTGRASGGSDPSTRGARSVRGLGDDDVDGVDVDIDGDGTPSPEPSFFDDELPRFSTSFAGLHVPAALPGNADGLAEWSDVASAVDLATVLDVLHHTATDWLWGDLGELPMFASHDTESSAAPRTLPVRAARASREGIAAPGVQEGEATGSGAGPMAVTGADPMPEAVLSMHDASSVANGGPSSALGPMVPIASPLPPPPSPLPLMPSPPPPSLGGALDSAPGDHAGGGMVDGGSVMGRRERDGPDRDEEDRSPPKNHRRHDVATEADSTEQDLPRPAGSHDAARDAHSGALAEISGSVLTLSLADLDDEVLLQRQRAIESELQRRKKGGRAGSARKAQAPP